MLSRPRVPGGLVAAGLAIGMDLDRPVDRHAAPADHLDAGSEGRVGEALEQARHDVVALAGGVVELLHQERQERGVLVIGRRQDIVGVEVAQALEDVDHLVVELALAERREPAAQELELLHRVDRVGGALERQVNVDVVDQDQRLIDDRAPLGLAQRARHGVEFGQADDRSEVRIGARVDRRGGFGWHGSRLLLVNRHRRAGGRHDVRRPEPAVALQLSRGDYGGPGGASCERAHTFCAIRCTFDETLRVKSSAKSVLSSCRGD
jgi:hypothetical protein